MWGGEDVDWLFCAFGVLSPSQFVGGEYHLQCTFTFNLCPFLQSSFCIVLFLSMQSREYENMVHAVCCSSESVCFSLCGYVDRAVV